MELNEIIMYSLQIFFVSAIIVISAVYILYRFKRKRNGIYNGVPVQLMQDEREKGEAAANPLK